MTTPPQDPNDMEDPQVGEVLPPMLYEALWEDAMEQWQRGNANDSVRGKAVKIGMELCFKLLLPYLKAALPCVEAMARDTRLKEADGALLVLAAQIKELTVYEQ